MPHLSQRFMLLMATALVIPTAPATGFTLRPLELETASALMLTQSGSGSKDSLQMDAIHLLDQAEQEYSRGQHQEAIALWHQAFQLFQDMGELESQMVTLNILASVYEQLGQRESVIQLLDSGLAVIRQLRNSPRERLGQWAIESSFLGTVGLAYAGMEEHGQAAKLHQQALEIAQQIGDRTEEARALNNLGIAYRHQGEVQQAIRAYEQSLAVAEELADWERQVNALGNLANTYRLSGEYRQAIDLYERAIAIAQEIDSGQVFTLNLFLANSYQALGGEYSDQGKYQQALVYLQRAHGITSSGFGNNTAFEIEILNRMGITYRNLGQYQPALNVLQQALAIAHDIQDREMEGHVLGNLGNTYMNLGQFQQGFELHQASLRIAQELDDPLLESRALGNVGQAYALLGEVQQAIEISERRLEIARNLKDPEGILAALGALIRIQSFWGGGWRIDHHTEALEVARTIGNPMRLANILEALADSNLEIHRDGDQITISLGLDAVLDMTRDYYQEARALYRSAGARDREASVLVKLAQAYLRSGQPEVAEGYLIEAIQILDEIRQDVAEDLNRVSLFQTQLNAFSLLQQALVDQGKVEASLKIAERGRGRAMIDLLSQRALDFELAGTPITPPDLESIKQFAHQTDTTLVIYSTIRQVDQNYELNRLFGGYDIGYGFDNFLYIWVVSPDGTLAFREVAVNSFNVAGLVTDAREAIGVRGDRASIAPDPEYLAQQRAQRQAQADQSLSQLYELLIAPIADLLPTHPEQSVVFMPQGELFLVPFAALKSPNGSYLIENHTILTAPSIQVLQLIHAIAARQNPPALSASNAVIVGNPTMPRVTLLKDGIFQDTPLNPLQGAQREAEAISRFLGTPALLGSAATEATVKQQMPGADIIHLATHGLLEYGDPQETGTRDVPGAIALAPGMGEDGLLTAAEILEMDLQAHLVVLSACDTGRGRVTGDGIIGLSRAFVAAGVPSIVVSLWAVPDAPTAELMTEFYRQLSQGQSKAQALRQAMLTLMETHPDPVNWAAFILIGEG
jgi:CHAT domain-containing protein/uncharacterized protein HemY